MNWKDEYKKKKRTLEEAAQLVVSKSLVSLGPISSFPVELVNAVTARKDLEQIKFISGMLMTFPDFLLDESEDRFRFLTLYMGPVERFFYEKGRVEPYSIHLSQAAAGKKALKPDMAILEVSPPDNHGFMCIGPGSSFMGKNVFTSADKVIVMNQARSESLRQDHRMEPA